MGSNDGPRPLSKEQRVARRTLGALSALLPVGLFASDPLGRLWYADQRICEAMQVNHRTDAGATVAIHPDDLATLLAPSIEAARTPRSSIAIRLTAPGRSDRTFRARAIPVVGTAGALEGVLGCLGGVSEGPEVPQAKRSALASADLLEAILEGSHEIATVLDKDGRWRYSSGEAWRLLGYRSDFDPLEGILALLHPDDQPVAAEWFERVVSGDDPVPERLESRVQTPSGQWRYLETVADVLLEDPVVHGILLHSRDVTERRRARIALEEERKRLETLVMSFPDPALLEDEERRVVIANSAFGALIGFRDDPSKLRGRRVSDIVEATASPSARAALERGDEIVAARVTVQREPYELANGRTFERDYVPIFAGDVYRGHLWLVRDVTARARAEAELATLVAHRGEENQRLHELESVKTELLSAISHELRSPLTSIVSFTQLLADGLGRDAPSEQAEYLEIVGRNATRLLRLVDDLLLLDRMDATPLPVSEMHQVDLPSLISGAVSAMSPRAAERSVSLETHVTVGMAIVGDGGRLEQLLDNLLSNAVKFSRQGGRVAIQAEPIAGGWLIQIADNGIGIPRDEQEQLFSRFFRASNATAARLPGSGLGLSVAKAIVELHGGAISVTSVEGSGTTFSVTLPRLPALRADSP